MFSMRNINSYYNDIEELSLRRSTFLNFSDFTEDIFGDVKLYEFTPSLGKNYKKKYNNVMDEEFKRKK